MAVTNGFGQGVINNTIEWGKGSTNATNGWGEIYEDSPSGDTAIEGASFTNTRSTDFDGVDDYVTMGNVLNMANDGTGSFSCSFWMKTNSTNQQWIVSKQLSSGNYGGFAIWIASGKLNFFLGSGVPNAKIQGKSTDSVIGTTWSNIVVTYDGSQDISGFNIYINGVSNTIVQVSNNTPTNVANTTSFQLSSRDGNTSLQYGGLLDEVGFWLGTELTSVQASAIYNSGNPDNLNDLSTPPTSWWRFEEGSGTTATDSGSGGNDGTLVNGVAYSTDVPT